MTGLRQRLRGAARERKPTTELNGLTAQEQLDAKRRHIARICLSTGIGCGLIGGAFLLTSSHTLHEMSVFLFGWAVGCAFALVNILLQKRLVDRERRSDKN